MTARLVAVVCTRDRPALLEQALAAMPSGLGPEDECVVVDSASNDGAAVLAVARSAGCEVVRADRPGLSVARNIGVAATTAPLIAFTDDDCIVAPGWAQAMAGAFDSAAVAFATGVVAADRETRLPLAVRADVARQRFSPGADPTRCGHGANMAFRRVALEGIGGFDEALGAGARFRAAEDVDAFWRLLVAGWEGVAEPSAAVTHVQWRSTSEALRVSYGYGVGLGAMAVGGVRGHRAGAWPLLGGGLWSNGVARAWRDLRAGYQSGAASSALRAAGVGVGAIRAAWREGRP